MGRQSAVGTGGGEGGRMWWGEGAPCLHRNRQVRRTCRQVANEAPTIAARPWERKAKDDEKPKTTKWVDESRAEVSVSRCRGLFVGLSFVGSGNIQTDFPSPLISAVPSRSPPPDLTETRSEPGKGGWRLVGIFACKYIRYTRYKIHTLYFMKEAIQIPILERKDITYNSKEYRCRDHFFF